MKTLDTYFGIEPFTVLVDDSPQLQTSVQQAQATRSLPFAEKLNAVKDLTIGAMINAYEAMLVWGKAAREATTTNAYNGAKQKQEQYQNLVFQKHPLSTALTQQAGCCRYQGALFFVLSYEADLGDQHFIHAAPVNERVNTVFNEVVDGDRSHTVSIFTESLKDKTFDYSRQNPKIFEQAFRSMAGRNFYSYHRTAAGLVLVENRDQHVRRGLFK